MLKLLRSYQSGPDTSHGGLIPKLDCSKSSKIFVKIYRSLCHLLSAALCQLREPTGNHLAQWPRFDHSCALCPTWRASSILIRFKRVVIMLLKQCSLKHLSKEVVTSLPFNRRLFMIRPKDCGSIAILATAAFCCQVRLVMNRITRTVIS